ncbi:uncharacterized protein BDZ99DRAFT_464803, partial [Mytilinidion resinicola]
MIPMLRRRIAMIGCRRYTQAVEDTAAGSTQLRLQHYNLGSTTHMPESYSPNISCREPS